MNNSVTNKNIAFSKIDTTLIKIKKFHQKIPSKNFRYFLNPRNELREKEKNIKVVFLDCYVTENEIKISFQKSNSRGF